MSNPKLSDLFTAYGTVSRVSETLTVAAESDAASTNTRLPLRMNHGPALDSMSYPAPQAVCENADRTQTLNV